MAKNCAVCWFQLADHISYSNTFNELRSWRVFIKNFQALIAMYLGTTLTVNSACFLRMMDDKANQTGILDLCPLSRLSSCGHKLSKPHNSLAMFP